MLSSQAFNAFLKTLEEPPKHAVFILATTEKHKIIPTILSRCQVYDFNRIKVEDAVDYLKHIAQQEGVSFDEESLNLIAQKADGGMRDALSMFDKAVSFCNSNLQYKEVAQTLNVLDYDTYFSMTELLLKGDYTTALIRFDEVLSKGFSAQTFMSGLNQHMRDLLLAKGPAISLIELTGTLLERYRQQATLCDTEFLFGAISILTEADGKIKQSSNQRLLVELGLMKIAGLGKKKNDDSPIELEYTLPDLPDQITPAQTQQGQTQAAQTQPVVAPSTLQPTAATTPAPQQAEESRPVATPPQAPQSVVEEKDNEATESAPVPAEPRTITRRTSLSGFSLSSLMGSSSQSAEQKQEEQQPTEQIHYDPATELKVTTHREAVIAAILEERPRFVVAFEKMKVKDHTILLEVPSHTLYEEIMRSKTEILLQIVRTAGIEGSLEMEIKVNEEIKVARPIKLEDRIRHMNEKNPHLAELKRVLDMEYE
jgi:DNA polymerase-3 subunit gamma/tau